MTALSPLQNKLSKRTQALLNHPQGMGNYFTFKAAIDILGLGWEDVAPGGVYAATGAGYFDMGYMANHIGPPASALKALQEAAGRPEIVSVYPPDCMPELKALVAEKKFSRRLGPDFEVLGVEGAQGGIGYTYLTFLDPGDEVIITDPGYFHFVPAAELCGARIVPIALNEGNGYRLKPEDVRAAMTARTKMIVVCDPINPSALCRRGKNCWRSPRSRASMARSYSTTSRTIRIGPTHAPNRFRWPRCMGRVTI